MKKKRRKRKSRYKKASYNKGSLVPIETPTEIRKEFSPELIKAYIKVQETDFENKKVYDAFRKLADIYLGDKADDVIED
ncbi:hypothetical protein LCGC14_1789650, partial [marine sediment metagenome]